MMKKIIFGKKNFHMNFLSQFFLIFDMIFWSQSPWSKYGPLGAKGLSNQLTIDKKFGMYIQHDIFFKETFGMLNDNCRQIFVSQNMDKQEFWKKII